MPSIVIMPRGAQILVRSPCAVPWGCLVTYLFQVGQRCRDTDAQRGTMPGCGGDSLAAGDAPGGAAMPLWRQCPRSGGPGGRGRAGRGRGRSMQSGRSTRSPALLLCPSGEEIGSFELGAGSTPV